MKITVTLQEISDRGDWDAYCELSGTNPWCMNERSSGAAEVSLTRQEAIDCGMTPGVRSPRREKLLMLDGPLLFGTGDFHMSGQFILFRVMDYEAGGGLHDAVGSYATVAEAEGKANEFKLDNSVDFHILDTKTGEGWSLGRK